MSFRSFEGSPTRIKPDTAERLTAAFNELDIMIVIKQTDAALTIGKTCINAVRSYTSERSIAFDHKVRAAIHAVLEANRVSVKDIQASHKAISAVIEEKQSRYLLSDMGNRVSMKRVEEYISKAQAVIAYVNDPLVQTIIKKEDALCALFPLGGYSEII